MEQPRKANHLSHSSRSELADVAEFGRRARLRIVWGNPWEFDPPHRHSRCTTLKTKLWGTPHGRRGFAAGDAGGKPECMGPRLRIVALKPRVAPGVPFARMAELGRRARFRSVWWKHREGSTPSSSTRRCRRRDLPTSAGRGREQGTAVGIRTDMRQWANW